MDLSISLILIIIIFFSSFIVSDIKKEHTRDSVNVSCTKSYEVNK